MHSETLTLPGDKPFLPHLIAAGAPLDLPNLAYVIGPVGSGKSTLLRALTADAARTRPVIALQLQPDNSLGYSASGATEFLDEEHFTAHVEQLLWDRPQIRPLLVVDGLGHTEDAQRIMSWAKALPRPDTIEIIVATYRDDVALSAEGRDPAIVIRVDSNHLPGLITGTIQRHFHPTATSWQMPLTDQATAMKPMAPEGTG